MAFDTYSEWSKQVDKKYKVPACSDGNMTEPIRATYGPTYAPTDGPYVELVKETNKILDKHVDGLTAVARKTYPIATGVIDYFPDAIMEISHVSYVGNEQHNPGQPLHWDRSKSKDEADALMRHFKDRGKFDTDGVRHSAKMAWRALALLQKELEAEK